MSRLPHALYARPAKVGCPLYHSVTSCLMFCGTILATSAGACCCSWMTSCSRVTHRDVGKSFGGRGVKSHLVRLRVRLRVRLLGFG